MSAELNEIIGRKQVELEKLNTEYDRVLLLLSKVLSGEISTTEVSVDLKSRSWTYDPNVEVTA